MKLLITGFAGFVCTHFLNLLNEVEPGSSVLGIDKNQPDVDFGIYTNLSISFIEVDLLNKKAIDEILISFSPNYLLHLASVSSVAQSWQTPLDSFVNNTNIFLNLVEQIRIHGIDCRVLSVGSSEAYGSVNEEELPLTEQHPLKPVSPYGVARVSQEMLSKIYVDGFNQDIIITRSFNHIGPGQKDTFAISSFAKQLVLIQKKNMSPNKIVAGDVSIIRDFLDVRDVVKAYYMLLKSGSKGEVYNICSGNGIVLKDIILKISELLQIKVEIEINPQLIRPDENKKIVGSYKKIKTQLNWSPEITLEKSLADIIDYWKEKTN